MSINSRDIESLINLSTFTGRSTFDIAEDGTVSSPYSTGWTTGAYRWYYGEGGVETINKVKTLIGRISSAENLDQLSSDILLNVDASLHIMQGYYANKYSDASEKIHGVFQDIFSNIQNLMKRKGVQSSEILGIPEEDLEILQLNKPSDLKSLFSEDLWHFVKGRPLGRIRDLVPREKDTFSTCDQAARFYLGNIEKLEKEFETLNLSFSQHGALNLNKWKELMATFSLLINGEGKVKGLKGIYREFLNNKQIYNQKEWIDALKISTKRIYVKEKVIRCYFGDPRITWEEVAREVPDENGKNTYDYLGNLIEFQTGLYRQMQALENQEGIPAQLKTMFSSFCEFMVTNHPLEMDKILRDIREYIAIRECPDMRHSKQGVADHVIETLPRLAPNTFKNPYVYLSEIQKNAEGYWIGEGEGKPYLILGKSHIPWNGHFF